MNTPQETGFPATDLRAVATQLQDVTRRLRDLGDKPMAQAVAEAAMELLPGAKWCSITLRDGMRFRSLAVTDEHAGLIDQVQYEVGSGPCLDAIMADRINVVSDLQGDLRWDAYGERALPLGVRAVFAQPLHLLDGDGTRAGLNVYSDQVGAFGDGTQDMAVMLATYAALGVSMAVSRSHAEQLEAALRTNRQIGMAIGILMEAHDIDHDDAFNLMRVTSQHTNRKMAAIADDVIAQRRLPRIIR